MTSTLEATDASMLAVVKEAGGVSVRSVPVRAVPPAFARVRVVATGLCGTDVHIVDGEYPAEAPVVMGHEIVGVVVEAGSPDDEGLVGSSVVCETYFSACETCAQCRAGRRNLCRSRRSLGSYEDGGFAESVVLPVLNLHVWPDTDDPVTGALCEPLACVAHCLLSPPVVGAGDRVLVTGPGAMGQLAAQVARAQGGRVTLAGLERDADRLAVAQGLGIETTTGAPEPDAYDVVVECSGSAPGAATALAAAARRGRYVQVGIFGRDVTLPLDLVLYKELTVTSGFASTPRSWRDALRLVADRRIDLAPLVTGRHPLTDFLAALDDARRGVGIKSVLMP